MLNFKTNFSKTVFMCSLLVITNTLSTNLLQESFSKLPLTKVFTINCVEAGMYDYYPQTEKLIKDIYRKWAQSNGVGIPDVDLRQSTYRDWDVVPPIREAEGTFYLAGNKNIEHTFSVRWRKKNNQLLRVVIDSKRIFYDEEAMWEAMDDPA